MTDKQVPVKLDQILAFLAMICRLYMHINYSVLPVGLNRNVNGTPEGQTTPTWIYFDTLAAQKGSCRYFKTDGLMLLCNVMFEVNVFYGDWSR